MKKFIAIISLSLLPLIVNAETNNAINNAAPVTEEASNSGWRTLATGLGIIGGVIIADLFMGGSLTYSLFGWGNTATVAVAGPVIYPPEVLNARAAGAVLGEMITPATNIRDVAARRDMFYALMLGVGGAVGAVVSYGLTGNISDSDVAVNKH